MESRDNQVMLEFIAANEPSMLELFQHWPANQASMARSGGWHTLIVPP